MNLRKAWFLKSMGFWVGMFCVCALQTVMDARSEETPALRILSGDAELQKVTQADCKGFKKSHLVQNQKFQSADEVVPKNWDGVELSTILGGIYKKLSAPENAKVDLIVIENAQGKKAFVPRVFIEKVGILLACNGHWVSVPNGQKKVNSTGLKQLPLGAYFLDDIRVIRLAHYRDWFGKEVLAKRNDPVALRGERLFLQTCLGCHAESGPTSFATTFLSEKGFDPFLKSGIFRHPENRTHPYQPVLGEDETRALRSYRVLRMSQTPQAASAQR